MKLLLRLFPALRSAKRVDALILSSHRFLFKIVLFSIFLFTYCVVAQAGTSIEPNEITFGKTAQIKVTADVASADTMIALQPAAPFASDVSLKGQNVKFLSKLGDALFAATEDNRIYSLGYQERFGEIRASLELPHTITGLYTSGDQLLVATDANKLLLYHADSNSRLTLSHTLNLTQPITAVALDAVYAYVLVEQKDLLIFQRNSIDAPPATIKLPAHFVALTVKNRIVYLSGDEIGLQIIDTSNLKQPHIYPGFQTTGTGLDIKIDNNLAYVADGTAGMAVFDVSNPENIQWLGSHNKVGPINAVAVYRGMTAIVDNENSRLISLDISNPQLPITDSFYKPRGTINDMLVEWPYTYLASSHGVERVDFSSGAAIQISNEGINQGGSRRAFVKDNIAYVADWFSGLHLYDISIPWAPRHIGNYHTPGSSKGVVVKGKYAFVGDDDHGLQVIDISDPHFPRKISEVLTSGLAYTMKRVNNRIYLADHRGGFDIIDITDVHTPHIIGSYDTPGKSWAIDVVDDIAYVADDSSGLLVFNVQEPENIRLIGQFNPGGYAEDVKIIGQNAYVAFFDKGFYILDISHPHSPRLVGHTPIPGNARSVTVDGSFAYLAGWESGLQVVDIHNLSSPTIVAYYDTDGSAWGVDIYQEHAYVWDWWGGVKVIDISNPLNPQAVGRYQGKGLIHRLAISTNYLYTANGAGGLQVYDIKNPLNPIWTTALDVSGSVRDVALAANKAYVAADDEGIIVANIADPFYVHWLGHVKTPGKISRVIGNQWAILAKDERAGLLVVDVSKPSNPIIKARKDIKVDDFYLHNGRVYVTSPGSLRVFELTPQFQLKPLAHYKIQNLRNIEGDTGKEGNWVKADGDFIYLTVAGDGIHILKLQEHHISPLGYFAFTNPIKDMRLFHDRIYAASEIGVLDIDISTPEKPVLALLYPATGLVGPITVNQKAIFLGGNETVNSVTRLADVTIDRRSANQATVVLPSTLPMGTYFPIFLEQNGDKQVLDEALSVRPAKTNKPKFTMDDFKKILEQQKLKSTPSTQ